MNVWTTIALSFALIACGSYEKEESDAGVDASTNTRRPQQELPDTDGNWRHPCDRRTVQTFKIDGGTWTVVVPTLCDPTPYIEKGDPPWQTQKSNEL